MENHFMSRRLASVALFSIVALTGSCAGAPKKAAWIPEGKPVRFEIPVFEVDGSSREEGLALANEFAAAWKEVSSTDSFVSDDTIIKGMLAKGQTIPSTNFSLKARFQKLGEKTLFSVTATDKETAQISALARTDGKSLAEIRGKFKKVARDLFEGK